MDTTKAVTHVGLCAGYGGIELGLRRVIRNLRTVALCEIEAYAVANLVSKMEAGLLDPAPIWPDLKTFPWGAFRDRVDILTGGYPCQPFSAAGQRKGKDDPRHLWPWIADGIRLLRPRCCFFENVEGHISLGLSDVIEDLAGMGYRTTWGIFSASEVSAPHQRKRVFILAHRDCAGLEGLWAYAGQQTFAEFGHGGNSWPSRPGQPQHWWEPPRVVGNAAQREDHRREPGDMGEASGAGRCGDHAADGASEAMGDTKNKGCRRLDDEPSKGGSRQAGGHVDWPSTSKGQECGQTQPPLGGNPDGLAGGLDYAELYVASDNRNDELRLLGNGVVPATAEQAFRILSQELLP